MSSYVTKPRPPGAERNSRADQLLGLTGKESELTYGDVGLASQTANTGAGLHQHLAAAASSAKEPFGSASSHSGAVFSIRPSRHQDAPQPRLQSATHLGGAIAPAAAQTKSRIQTALGGRPKFSH